MVGKTVSHYKILEHLGRGGMGVVYKARDLTLDRFVALKFLPPGLTWDSGAKQRFIHEAKAASALDHNNICNIHEIGETDDGQIFIVMAFYEGETLKKKIERKPLEIDEALNITTQVARGLAKAHEHGIVHRDIKPANIMVTNDGVAKILDFGLAKLVGDVGTTKTASTMGTIPYMSPEQLAGEDLDARTDIWALGVLLFEMLTGRLPFRGDHLLALMYSITHEPPLPLEKLRQGVTPQPALLVGQCLAKDRASRLQSMDDVLNVLAPMREKEFLHRSAAWSKQWTKRTRMVVAGIGLAAAIGWALYSRFVIPTPPLPHHLRLGVLEFQNLSGDSSINSWQTLVPHILGNQLTGIENVGFVNHRTMRMYLESSLPTFPALRGPDVYQTIKRAGVDFVIEGTIQKLPETYGICVNVVNAADGETRYTPEVIPARESGLTQAIALLAKRIVDHFEVEENPEQKDRHLEPWYKHRSRSLEAEQAFLHASELLYNSEPGSREYLLRALQLDSTFVSPRVWLISGMVGHGEIQEANRNYQILLSLEPQVNHFEQAMIRWCGAYIAGDLTGQERALEKALTYSVGNNILLINLAEVRFARGEYESAISTMRPALDMWNYPGVHPTAAKCYIKLGRYDEAKNVLVRALSMKPVDPETYALLSFLAARDSDYSALNHYENLLFAQDTRGFVSMILFDLYKDMGFWPQAAAAARQATKADDKNPLGHEALGQALYNTGDTSGAMTEYKRAWHLQGTRLRALFMVGKIADERGDAREATASYKRLLSLDSTSTDARWARQRVGMLSR